MLDVVRSAGGPLDPDTRATMENRFGHDFSRVRVHTDTRAADSARAVNADAYTVGNDIAFDRGRYAPATRAGRRLLAHELGHVTQASKSAFGGYRGDLRVLPARDPREREAARGAQAISEGRPERLHTTLPPGTLARQEGGGPPTPEPGTGGAEGAGPAAAGAKTFSVTTDACDKAPFDEPTVMAAARAAFDMVLNSDCVKSKGLKDDILKRFDGLTIHCGQEDTPCGKSRRYFTSTVKIFKAAMDPGRCGPLESTILHEVCHQTEWRLFGHGETADACERSCFGWGNGDPDKCK